MCKTMATPLVSYTRQNIAAYNQLANKQMILKPMSVSQEDDLLRFVRCKVFNNFMPIKIKAIKQLLHKQINKTFLFLRNGLSLKTYTHWLLRLLTQHNWLQTKYCTSQNNIPVFTGQAIQFCTDNRLIFQRLFDLKRTAVLLRC